MSRQEDRHRYDDMIDLPHPVSKKRPQMAVADRAAQFAPFAALTGHGAAIGETARLTETRIELDETEIEVLDEKLRMLEAHAMQQPELTVTYFLPDARKEGGSYRTVCGNWKKADRYAGEILLQDGQRIPVSDMIRLESPLFEESYLEMYLPK